MSTLIAVPATVLPLVIALLSLLKLLITLLLTPLIIIISRIVGLKIIMLLILLLMHSHLRTVRRKWIFVHNCIVWLAVILSASLSAIKTTIPTVLTLVTAS